MLRFSVRCQQRALLRSRVLDAAKYIAAGPQRVDTIIDTGIGVHPAAARRDAIWNIRSVALHNHALAATRYSQATRLAVAAGPVDARLAGHH